MSRNVHVRWRDQVARAAAQPPDREDTDRLLVAPPRIHPTAQRLPATTQQLDLAASTARLQALLGARGMPNAAWFDEALREPEVDPLAGVREVVARHLPREASW